MIIDTDAHQGNGHERDFVGDPDTFILDIYNELVRCNFECLSCVRYFT